MRACELRRPGPSQRPSPSRGRELAAVAGPDACALQPEPADRDTNHPPQLSSTSTWSRIRSFRSSRRWSEPAPSVLAGLGVIPVEVAGPGPHPLRSLTFAPQRRQAASMKPRSKSPQPDERLELVLHERGQRPRARRGAREPSQVLAHDGHGPRACVVCRSMEGHSGARGHSRHRCAGRARIDSCPD